MLLAAAQRRFAPAWPADAMALPIAAIELQPNFSRLLPAHEMQRRTQPCE
jgi:hypothetical protein